MKLIAPALLHSTWCITTQLSTHTISWKRWQFIHECKCLNGCHLAMLIRST